MNVVNVVLSFITETKCIPCPLCCSRSAQEETTSKIRNNIFQFLSAASVCISDFGKECKFKMKIVNLFAKAFDEREKWPQYRGKKTEPRVRSCVGFI